MQAGQEVKIIQKKVKEHNDSIKKLVSSYKIDYLSENLIAIEDLLRPLK